MTCHRLLRASACAVALCCTPSFGASFIAEIVSYTPGTGVGIYTDPTVVVGAPSGDAGFGSIVTPFNPAFSRNDLARIGVGGSITVRLENFVLIDRNPGTYELGIWENLGLIDEGFPGPEATGATALEFGSDYARVEVSPDNVNWYSLNGGDRILFQSPTNYYTNATDSYSTPTNGIVADFGKPFNGTLGDFDGKTFAETLSVLNGSAGGTWLNLDGLPLSVNSIGYVRISDPLAGPSTSPTDNTFELYTMSINRALAGAPTPEPTAGCLLVLAGAWLLAQGRRRA